ncbi:MAG: ABC transporter ATP-binding protein [Bacteroidetes bacterium]|nr:ABC transporter ATP-binding protein [Bacteroidota bacterium]
MLRLRDISHTYRTRKSGETHALGGVSFDARPGEVTAVIGPNGSGKSTMFGLVTGGLALQQGSVTLDGQPVGGARTGVVFQSPALDQYLSVFENLAYHAMLFGLRLKRSDLPAELIDGLDLADRLDTRVDELSGGFQRRVELAKALMTEPELLVLDEPFTGLDPAVRDGFFAMLEQATTSRGLVTLLVTHDLGMATRCARVVLLDSGRVAADARPSELLAGFGSTVVVIRGRELHGIEAQVREAKGPRTLRVADDALLLCDTSLRDVLKILDEHDPRIEDIEARRPSLDDYFVSVSGFHPQGGIQELEAA